MSEDDQPTQQPPSPNEIEDRWELEYYIRNKMDDIASSFFAGIEPPGSWSVDLVSWTGLEWDGMPGVESGVFVEAIDSQNPPHDHLFVFRTRDNGLHMLACYRKDGDLLCKITKLEDGELMGLPETVPWRSA